MGLPILFGAVLMQDSLISMRIQVFFPLKTAPDFESPADSDGDNLYGVDIFSHRCQWPNR